MAMKTASAAFLAILLLAHLLGNSNRLADRPLSMFRDHERIWLGYTMFGLLTFIRLAYLWPLVRCRRYGEIVFVAPAVVMLLIVAATPSTGLLHAIFSFALLAMIFAHFAILLYLESSLWLLAHLLVPAILMFAARYQSYGVWQKGLIVYFVIAAAIRHHFLMQQLIELHRGETPMRPKRPRKEFRLKFASKRPPKKLLD